MNEVARLEAQLEAADMKPKSKMSQRPKDTVPRDQIGTNSSIQGTKIKIVEYKQIKDLFLFLKLSMQKDQVPCEDLGDYIFGDFEPENEI